MKIMRAITNDKKLQLIIDCDENAGFYLLVYPLDSTKSMADYLCDTLEEASFEAKERYGVRDQDWEKF